jgi:hypothetical protein
MQILFNALVQASLYTDRGLRITPVYWQAQWKVVLTMDMSVPQQTVLPGRVCLQQPVLPLDMFNIKQSVLPLGVSL